MCRQGRTVKVGREQCVLNVNILQLLVSAAIVSSERPHCFLTSSSLSLSFSLSLSLTLSLAHTAHIDKCTCTCEHARAHTHVCVCVVVVFTFSSLSVFLRAPMDTQRCIDMHTLTHTQTHTHRHTHTHTHTHTLLSKRGGGLVCGPTAK